MVHFSRARLFFFRFHIPGWLCYSRWSKRSFFSCRDPKRLVRKSGFFFWSKEKIKSKKSFDLWDGLYVVLARISEVNYKVAKQSNPSKLKFLHFNTLERYVEDTGQPEEAIAGKRTTPYWSAIFFEDPEMHIEDEAIWVNNREGFNHDPGPKQEPVGILSLKNRAVVEPLVNSPGLNGVLRRQSDAVETYDEREMGARREEKAANVPSEAEGSAPGEMVVVEPLMESETTDVGRPIRIRKPPVRFDIDEYAS